MANATFHEPSKALRRAFFGAVDKALAETVRDILGDATPDEASTQEAWSEALSRIEKELRRKVEVRTGTANSLTRSGRAVMTTEVEVMRYEIWVDGRATREVVISYQVGPPKFFIKSRLI